MGFVDDQQEVFWEVVNERRGCGSCVAAVDVAGVVLNPGTETYLFDHFQVVFGAHAQTLRFQEFATIFQILQPHGQFRFDGLHCFFHPFRPGNIVCGGENTQFIGLADHVTGEWVDVVQGINFVAEEFHTHGKLFVGGNDVHRVAFNAEGTSAKRDVVTRVLNVYQQSEEAIALDLIPHLQEHGPVQVGLRGAQAVNARHRAYHHDVATRKQAGRSGVAQALDIFIDGGVFFNVGIGLRDVGFRLVVVVVADKIFNGIIGQQLPEFVGQLRSEGFIRGHDEGRPLHFFNKPGCRGRFTGTRRTHQHNVPLTTVNAVG